MLVLRGGGGGFGFNYYYISFINNLKLLIKLFYKLNPFYLFFLYINKRQLINTLTSLISVAVALIPISYFLVFIVEVAIF